MSDQDTVPSITPEQLEKQFPVLRFFKYAHLPPSLQCLSKPLGQLAFEFALSLKDSENPAEVATGLRKLLEAKDCFVRARLKADGQPIKT